MPGELLDDGEDAPQFVLAGNRCGAGTGRFPPYVNNLGAFIDETQGGTSNRYRLTRPMTRQARSVGAGGTAASDIGGDSISKKGSARSAGHAETGDRSTIPGEYRLFFRHTHGA